MSKCEIIFDSRPVPGTGLHGPSIAVGVCRTHNHEFGLQSGLTAASLCPFGEIHARLDEIDKRLNTPPSNIDWHGVNTPMLRDGS